MPQPTHPTAHGRPVSGRTEAGIYWDPNGSEAAADFGVVTLPAGADTTTLASINATGLTRFSFAIEDTQGAALDAANRVQVVATHARVDYLVYDAAWGAPSSVLVSAALPAPIVAETLRLQYVTAAGQVANATLRPILFGSAL